MMKRTFVTTLLFCLFSITTVFAAQTSCPEHFANGQAPNLNNQKLLAKTKDVCYTGFALKHSGITRTPIYSAEHLTRDRLATAKGMKRTSKFYPDPNYQRQNGQSSGQDMIVVTLRQVVICSISSHSRNVSLGQK